MYNEDDMLMLSGIQHYMFCPRQWGLIHISQEWEDNRLTVEGQLLHENVDNPFYRQKNGDVITLRSVHIASRELGLYGIADAIELLPAESSKNAITHKRYPGFWYPYPIEYKRGHRKSDERDEVQLTAQVMCLEEMYGIRIEYGALFYGETRRREVVHIDEELRRLTIECAEKMHIAYNKHSIPKSHKKLCCNRCSLVDICLPELEQRYRVSDYLKRNLYEETT